MVRFLCILALCASAVTAAVADEISVATILSATQFDITSKPASVPSQKKIKALWDAYKTAKECQEHPTYAPGTPLKLRIFKAAELADLKPQSPFPSAVGGQATCNSSPVGKSLKPVVTLKLDEAYGHRNGAIESAMAWLADRLADNRYNPSGESPVILRNTLIEWASAGALKKGINVSWDEKPIDYQVSTFITALTIAFAETAAAMTPDERAKVGAWLNPLVANSVRSEWAHTDDHESTVAVSGLVWGLTVGDVQAIQWAIDIYKKHINLMRPDGSFPIDTQRSGAGLLYNNQATGNLVVLAAIAKSGLGLDLFNYSVDGRSIHNAVDFVLRTMRDPSLNKQYAISCPGGGDLWGTPAKPAVYWISGSGAIMNSSYLGVYASNFPDREDGKWIALHLDVLSKQFKVYQGVSASPVCMMNANMAKP